MAALSLQPDHLITPPVGVGRAAPGRPAAAQVPAVRAPAETAAGFNESSGELDPDERHKGTYDKSAVRKIGEDEGVDVWWRTPDRR